MTDKKDEELAKLAALLGQNAKSVVADDAKRAKKKKDADKEAADRDAENDAKFKTAFDNAIGVLNGMLPAIGADSGASPHDARGKGLCDRFATGPDTLFDLIVYVRVPLDRSGRSDGPAWKFGFGRNVLVGLGFHELIGCVIKIPNKVTYPDDVKDITIVYRGEPDDMADDIEFVKSYVMKMIKVITDRKGQ